MAFPDLEGIGAQVARELGIVKPIRVEPYPYTTAKCTCRERSGKYLIRVSHFFEDAPREVIGAVIGVVLSRAAKRHPGPYLTVYNRYIKNNKAKRKLEGYRALHAGKVLRGGRGRVHDLTASFTRVNREYFNGHVRGITFTWGRPSRRTLGHYDSAKRTIVISAILDRRRIPEYLVDFIVYHELLHHEIPTFYRNGRRVIHSPEFRKREKEFRRYPQARRLMKKL